jgi:3D (Asp-Asp-Asp) domain-containing protein
MQDIREAERRLVSRPRSVERLMGTSAQDNLVNAPRLTQVEREYRMLATAYDAGPVDNTWEYAGITTLGWRTRRGIAAVDPAVIPLRTLLYVEGYGFAWAGDVGGAIKGKRIDLCFNKTEDVHKWGKKYVRVYVLRGVRKRK